MACAVGFGEAIVLLTEAVGKSFVPFVKIGGPMALLVPTAKWALGALAEWDRASDLSILLDSLRRRWVASEPVPLQDDAWSRYVVLCASSSVEEK